MQITFNIPEKELAEFSKKTIQEEIERMPTWLKIKHSFKEISHGLKVMDKNFYEAEIERIKKSSWLDFQDKYNL